MSDGMRRIVCRTTFVLFGLLPTLVVVNWALFPRTPAEWQATLQPHLGLLLRIERVVTATPFQTRLEQVQIADPQRRLLARLPRVDWSHEPAAHALELAPFAVNRDELTQGCRHLLVAALGWSAPVSLQVAALRVVDPTSGAECTLHNCRVQLQPTATGPMIAVTFHIDPNLAEPVRWEFQAQPETAEDGSFWQLDTGGHALPAWLLAHEISELAACGSSATVRGRIQVGDDPTRRVYDIAAAELRQVDLHSCFGQPLGLTASGLLDLDIAAARIADGRIESLSAIAVCPHGQLPARLLATCRQWLGFQVAEPAGDVLDFANLALGLEIQNNQVTLRSPGQGNALLCDRGSGQALALAPQPLQSLPVHVLACALAKENAYAVPADPQVQRLLQYLPLEQ